MLLRTIIKKQFCKEVKDNRGFILNIPNRVFPLFNKRLESLLKNEKINFKLGKSMNFQKNTKDEYEYCIPRNSIKQYYSENKSNMNLEDKLKILYIYNVNQAMLPIMLDDSINELISIFYKNNKFLDEKQIFDKNLFLEKNDEKLKCFNKALETYEIKFLVYFTSIFANAKKETIDSILLFKLYYLCFDLILNFKSFYKNTKLCLNLFENLLISEMNDFKKGLGTENTLYKFSSNKVYMYLIEEYLVNNFDKLESKSLFSFTQKFESLYYLPRRLNDKIIENTLLTYDIGNLKSTGDYVLYMIHYLLNTQSIQYHKLKNNCVIKIINITRYFKSSKIEDITYIIKILVMVYSTKLIDNYDIKALFDSIYNSILSLISYLDNKSTIDLHKNLFLVNSIYSSIVYLISENKKESTLISNDKTLIQPNNEAKELLKNRNLNITQITEAMILLERCLVSHYSKFSKNYTKSKFKLEIEEILKNLAVVYKQEIIINSVSVDLFIPEKKLCVFLNGVYHYYRNENIIKSKEIIKYNILENSGYKVRIICYSQYKSLFIDQESKDKYISNLIREIEI